MTKEKHALQILAKLSTATDYSQADQILNNSENELQALYKEVIPVLENKITELSPLDCNSLQWSIYKYTLVYTRSQMEMA
ncbi:hypothetical protein DVR12_12230 [Chitinophaga silvatica]|uniref:Uncharacterized protein n=1 Tax=Chitinophaga silvatica TaxID=2282649 RepID=A0A3E1Y9Y9_9BACT|nr:hypothetical protein [Chitinophaga silvatica]RFS22564.1 hypothetical protein DVR12_12230 [Chitinophaga silvatica]